MQNNWKHKSVDLPFLDQPRIFGSKFAQSLCPNSQEIIVVQMFSHYNRSNEDCNIDESQDKYACFVTERWSKINLQHCPKGLLTRISLALIHKCLDQWVISCVFFVHSITSLASSHH